MVGKNDHVQVAEDALDAAISRVQQSLSTSQSLAQLESVRLRVASEMATKDAQLKTAVRNHLDSATSVTALVGQAQSLLGSVAKNLSSVTALSNQSLSLVNDYAALRDLHNLYTRLASARTTARSLRTVDEKVNEIRALIEADTKNIMNARYILYVFMVLCDLESFRERSLRDASRLSPEVVASLRARFVGVWEVSAQYESLLMALTGKLLPLARRNPAVVVAVSRVVDKAEELDERTLDAADDSAGGFTRNYRDKVMHRLRDGITEAFEGRLAVFSDDLEGALTNITMQVDELTFVLDDVVPLFPPSFGIFELFVREYHSHTLAALDGFAARGLEPKQLVQVLHFSETYRVNMAGRLGVPDAWLQPPLLAAGTADALFDEFRRVVKGRLGVWTANIIVSERNAFRDRAQLPPVDTDGRFASAVPIDLFGLANQQIDIGAMSRSPPLIRAITDLVASVFRDYTNTHVAMIEAEEARYFGSSEAAAAAAAVVAGVTAAAEGEHDAHDAHEAPSRRAPVAPHLFEYLIMEVNSHEKSAGLVEQLAGYLKSILRGPNWSPAMDEQVAQMENFFRAASRRAVSSIVAIVTADVSGAAALLFTPKWYDGDPMRDIMATFADYAQDLSERMVEFYFTKTMYELLDWTLITYINAMLARSATFKPSAAARFESDSKTIASFFEKHLIGSRVAKSVRIIIDIQALAAGDVAALVTHCSLIKTAYPDITPHFVERILSKRSDLTKEKMHRVLMQAAGVLSSKSAPGAAASILSRVPRFAEKKP